MLSSIPFSLLIIIKWPWKWLLRLYSQSEFLNETKRMDFVLFYFYLFIYLFLNHLPIILVGFVIFWNAQACASVLDCLEAIQVDSFLFNKLYRLMVLRASGNSHEIFLFPISRKFANAFPFYYFFFSLLLTKFTGESVLGIFTIIVPFFWLWGLASFRLLGTEFFSP